MEKRGIPRAAWDGGPAGEVEGMAKLEEAKEGRDGGGGGREVVGVAGRSCRFSAELDVPVYFSAFCGGRGRSKISSELLEGGKRSRQDREGKGGGNERHEESSSSWALLLQQEQELDEEGEQLKP